MTHVIDDCAWPDLKPPYDRALRAAVAWVLTQVTPFGIIATGTIVRGEAHASSDIDLYVLHEAPFRRRVQRYFEDVPVEIFINNPESVRSYLQKEQKTGRRVTAHMIATGSVVLDKDPLLEMLREEARQWLDAPEKLGRSANDAARYAPASQLEDAADIVTSDPLGAGLILHRAVWGMIEFAFRRGGRAIPRSKSMMSELEALDPNLSRLVRQFVDAPSVSDRLQVAQQLADQTIEARGFFEWDSGPEPAPPVIDVSAWPPGSPEAAVLRFLAAMHEERWDDAVDLIDPEAGAQFGLDRRRFFLERNQRSVSVDEYRKMMPDASPEVIEWHMTRQAQARERRPNDWADAFAGVHDDASLEALDARGLLRSLLEAGDIRYRYRLAYAAAGYPIPERLSAYMNQQSTIHPLGHIPDSADRALVMYRQHAGPHSEPGVIELTRHADGGWRLPPQHALTLESGATVFLVGPRDAAELDEAQ